MIFHIHNDALPYKRQCSDRSYILLVLSFYRFRKRHVYIFPIWSYVDLWPTVSAILVHFFVYSFEIKHQRFKRPSKDQKIQLGFISATSIREDICNTITQGLMLIHIQQGIYLGFTVAIFPF